MTIPVSNIYVTFSNTAIDYTAFGINVRNISCSTGASIMKLGVNGQTKFRIDMDGNISNQREVVWVPAKSMIPSMTNGASYGYLETPTSKLVQSTMDFSSTSEQSSQFDVLMPKSWNKNQVKFKIIFKPAANGTSSTSNGVVWRMQAVSMSNNEIWDPILSSNAFVTIRTDDDQKIYISDDSDPLTVDGNPQDNDLVVFKIFRDTANAADTLPQFTNLLGVQVILNP